MTDLIDSDMMARIEHLQLIARRMATGRMRGERRSNRRGMSTDFADYRNYVSGDDIRHLDWKIYARLERLCLKLFMEEEDLNIDILIDTSKSMDLGEPNKLHYAKIKNLKTVKIWGTGKPKREFLYSADLAKACNYILNVKNCPNLLNIGTNKEIEISKLAELIKKMIGFEGSILFDKTKPDGVLSKILNSKKINQLGWKHNTNLIEGIEKTYNNFLINKQ